jgi:AcrR family transcriptional regulator
MGRRPRVSRENVLRAAREAFAERGYEGTTLASISARLGLSPAALLRHAPSKEALFTVAMQPASGPAGLPLDFLKRVDPSSDPRRVLRRVAQAFIPFIETKLSEDIVHSLHIRERTVMPAQNVATLTDYFRRGTEAGRLKVRDPKTCAMAFLGSLQAYVFLHKVLRAFDPPFPMNRYVDGLIDIWTHGTVPPKKRLS